MVEYSPRLHEECFSFLNREDASALLSVMEMVELPAGSLLYADDDPADCLYIVVAGRVAVQKETGFGDRMQVVALFHPGAPLGESGLLAGKVRGATLTAVSELRLLVLSRQAFSNISIQEPALAVKILTWLLEKLALRLQKSSERLAHVL
jgi:CRP-like cAMP-binding protein